MKKITLTVCTIILFACICKVNAQTEAEMKAWTEYMTPGESHKMLAKSDGDWNAEMTMWMAPNTAPTQATTTVNNKMVLGGRYQQSTYTGTMMGMPFEGMSTVAYDNAKKKFVSTWIDNMGTGITVMEGTWDNTKKSITTKGKTFDPLTHKDVMMREVLTMIDDNTQKMEMYTTPAGGKEYKNMEIKLTRK